MIASALEKDPARRLQSAGQLLSELQELKHRAESGAAVLRRRPPARAIRSLAVLPLVNLSGDPEQDYFADGMTEELTTCLAQISALRVVSRTSANRYKGTQKPIPEVARELAVEAIIEGSVLRTDTRVRVTAQMIDATSDTHLWARSYERDLQDVLRLQNEIARTIASEIQLKLTPAEENRLSQHEVLDPTAHDDYLRGQVLAAKQDGPRSMEGHFVFSLGDSPPPEVCSRVYRSCRRLPHRGSQHQCRTRRSLSRRSLCRPNRSGTGSAKSRSPRCSRRCNPQIPVEPSEG